MAVGSKINADGAGPDITSADVAISAGWGGTASVAVLAGSNDTRGKLTVTASATPAADPTITVTYDKAKEAAPFVFAQRCDEDQAAGDFRVSDITTTTFVITFEGTPVAAEVYEVEYLVVE